ncbi:iron-containing alcohol dehydrogenase [Desulfofundulus thermobenzoicus]|uniref:Iron-containing alcohol dehydrogenase n=1 Tax=Desulfofundulus thermobenzoicus TaxID=29376 RepID=A0A6N7IL63_9FIRM|nr:iron-containing alcohol dehydrogenase [Desulfofundulus thermobenzoicus]MQL50716.1 iron-containing alcohol dehydrogenase [Desulfofundulus thermobenzoicus]
MELLNSFTFQLPTRVEFGLGVSQKIGDEAVNLGGECALIVTDPGVIKAGIIDQVTSSLKQTDISYSIFSDIEPNPRDTSVEKGAEIARKSGADLLVAVGGGSAIDTAKGIGVLLTHGGAIQYYEGLGKVSRPITPLIAIPTTAGTGSEVTFWAVITDTERRFKMSVGSPLIAPKVALVDPEVTKSLPPLLTASTGMDALTHAIEAYTATLANPVTDGLALYAIELISSHIRQATFNGYDLTARSGMLLGSLIAGMAFGNSDVAAVHCMAEAVGGLYDIPHGIANAILLPHVMEYNASSCGEKYARIASVMGVDTSGLGQEESARKAVAAVMQLTQDLKLPTLKEVGVKEGDLPELARRAAANVSVESNPRKVTFEDFLKIFRKAFLV